MNDTDNMGKQIEEQNRKIKELEIQLRPYEEDSAELLKEHGVDPDDKIDREDLKRMLNYLIGINVQLKQSCKAHAEYARQRLDKLQEIEAENKQLREILTREVDDGRAEVDDIGIEAWIEQALKGEK